MECGGADVALPCRLAAARPQCVHFHELHSNACITDDTWAVLAAHLNEQQRIEVPMLVGQYHIVSFTLNTLEIQREPGLGGFNG